MPLAVTSRSGRWYVQGEMTIYCAALLQRELLPAVRDCSQTMNIDLSEVTEIDTAGLQVLLLAQRVARASGTRLVFVDASAAVREALTVCCLTQLLAANRSDAVTP